MFQQDFFFFGLRFRHQKAESLSEDTNNGGIQHYQYEFRSSNLCIFWDVKRCNDKSITHNSLYFADTLVSHLLNQVWHTTYGYSNSRTQLVVSSQSDATVPVSGVGKEPIIPNY